MGETFRHRSDGACWSTETTINARTLSENRIMHVARPQNPSPAKRRVVIKAPRSSFHSLKSWWNDPEMKRQRRISSYKYYSAEANVKRSFKKGIRWLGKKCSIIIRRL